MALCINQSGTYRNSRTLCVNQSGTYRNIKCGCINQSATYRCFGFTAATITSFTATPSEISEGNSSTLCWTIANATNASISPTVGTISPSVTGSSVVSPTTLGNTAFTLTIGGGGANLTCTICVCQTGPNLGSNYCGGLLICKSSPTRWIAAPNNARIGAQWPNREAANTCAQQVSGVGGWFIPSNDQFSNPGNACKGYWLGWGSEVNFWSNNEVSGNDARSVSFSYHDGFNSQTNAKWDHRCAQSFRTVSY